jgi:peptidoglycan/LPS O-acetylase OafA/YrhL
MGQRSGRSRAKRERSRQAARSRRLSLATDPRRASAGPPTQVGLPATQELEAAAGADPTRSEGFRPDVEGMRGLAVMLVVLFHAGLAGMAGGFIGVDVFFVISGFLITGLLVRERERTGSVDLLHFYARRARRILPAAVTVIAITLPVAILVLDPLSRESVITDGVTSALSIGNIRSALVAGDYFSTVGTSSPFLHFWSLGVEEQFYLIWPVLLILAARSRRPRLGIGTVLCAVAIASFAAELAVTQAAPNWAFYSLPTRAWQLAIGGLLALAMMPGVVRLRWRSTAPARAAKPARSGKPARSRKPARSVEPIRWRAWSPMVPAGTLAVVGWLGLAAIVWSALSLSDGIAYPGPYALVPTVGAVAVIVAGPSRFGPRLALGLPPLRFLGRISYSLYLWHWPLLVLPAVALGSGGLGATESAVPGLGDVGTGAGSVATQLDWSLRVVLVTVSIAVATISCFAIEEPFRRSVTLASRPRRTLGLAFTTLATVVSLAGVLAFGVSRQFDDAPFADFGGSTTPAAALVAAEDPSVSTAAEDSIGEPVVILAGSGDQSSLGTVDQSPPGADPSAGSGPSSAAADEEGAPDAASPPAASPPTGSSSVGPIATATATPARPSPVTRSHALPVGISPSLASAHDDRERLWSDGCLAYEAATAPHPCVYGDRAGTFTVALVGDSHGAQWFPAFDRVAQHDHWRLLVFTKVSCPFIDLPVWSNTLKREYTECAAWNAAVVAKLANARPDLTVIAMSHWILPLRSADRTVAAEAAALAREIALVHGPSAIMVDTPHARGDVPDCLASHRADIRPCATPRTIALSGHGLVERAAARRADVATIDLYPDICPASSGTTCPAVVDGMIVYRDYHHLTATFAASLAPGLDRALAVVIGR